MNFAIVANVTEYSARVNFADSNISSVTFTNGQESRTVSNSGDAIDLDINTEYTVTAAFADGYELNSWTATGGTLVAGSANAGLHITPWTTPNRFTIRMVDYQGNTVWRQSFDTTGGTTHWFVGANVKRVYLTGIPGGVVDVTDTEH